MSSNLEMKMNDALFGLAPNFALPCTKKFDGKKLTFEFAKSFNDLKLAVDTTFTPASGALGNVVKADYNANGITAGVKASVDNVAGASFHITTAVKNQTVGVKGALNNPTALSLVYAPSPCLTVNTDMTQYDISYHLKGDSHQVGLQWGWIMGSEMPTLVLLPRRPLPMEPISISSLISLVKLNSPTFLKFLLANSMVSNAPWELKLML